MNHKPRIGIAVILGITLMISALEVQSQFSFYKNFTVNDGLPSSKIYHMIQDSKGYIWFATENGVSRFDGYEFKNFTAKDGLPTNSTLKLYEDYKGRIWFLSYKGLISYYYHGSINRFKVNDLIEAMDINFFDNIYVDSTDQIWATPLKGGVYKIDNSMENIEVINSYDHKAESLTLYLEENQNGYILGLLDGPEDSTIELVEKKDNAYYVHFFINKFSLYEHKKFFRADPKRFYISFKNTLRFVEDDSIKSELEFSKSVLYIYVDLQNNLWVSVNFDGIYFYANCDLTSSPVHFLEGYSVSTIIQDKSMNYWLSTTEKGVFLVPSLDFNTYNSQNTDLENEIIYSISRQKDIIYASTNNKKIYTGYLDQDNLYDLKEFKVEGETFSNINDILVASDGSLWITSTEYLHYTNQGKAIFIDTINNNYGYEFIELADNKIYMAIQNGFNVYKDSRRYLLNEVNMKYNRTFAIHEGSDGIVWLGNLYGVFFFQNGEMHRFKEDDPVISTRISDINSIGEQIWIGTFDNGMAVISDDTIIYIDESTGLSSNRIKVIYIEDDNNVWIGTNNGLNHIIIDEKINTKFSIEIFTIWDGLPSNEVNDILKHGEIMWLGTDKGLVSFYPLNLSKVNCIPSIYFEKILINEKVLTDFSVKPELRHNEHNINIYYKAICFKNPGNVTYSYKLLGLEDDWITTKNISVRYGELAPSDYRFQLKAKSIDGAWSDVIEYNFRIHNHYTQTILFKILIFIIGIGIIGIIFWIILKNQKNKETLRHQVILAEQKAIRSQMNPHFLFNSLNSIQHLILNKEGEVANYYLTNLSKLMRRILDNSKYTTIPLKDELENIKLYLDLEKFRFENHFEYKINVDDSIKVDEIVIPSMIIQPYLENAIWHGMVPKDGKGTLELSIMKNSQNNLLIVIEDNGIGRIEAEKIAKRRKNYKSMGMKNTKERINLLNRLFNTHYKVSVNDLFDENNDSKGTRIELTLDM